MVKITLRLRSPQVIKDLSEYIKFLKWYFRSRVYKWFAKFELFKNILVDLLYKKRGKYVRPFLHFGTIGLVFFVITVGPVVMAASDDDNQGLQSNVLYSTTDFNFQTQQTEFDGESRNHVVSEGETISDIANKYGLDQNTILWENNLSTSSKISPGDELIILPVDGVNHKVSRGETVFSIGKKYKLDESQVQQIIDYPFNAFLNDETFELATGQELIVPDGIKSVSTGVKVTRIVQKTPDAGTVTALGSFVWPASGSISQGYRVYHRAFDIASGGGGPILASDAGTVIASGWVSSGYGNRVIIDHGNGFQTLYAHNSVLNVSVGQRVNRGDVIAQMGSTGRSTGTHLHFEIRQGGVLLNPASFLR